MTRFFPHLLARTGVLAVALLLLPVLSASSNLQLGTTVLTIVVPASAFNLATGTASVTVTSGIQLSVKATGYWHLQVRAISSAFTFVTQPGAGTPMPVTQLTLRPVGGGSQFVMSTANQVIASGAPTAGWKSSPFDTILQVTSANAGGQYTVTLEFNIY